VGKYMQLQDSYLSVAESLRHGGFANGVNVEVGFIDSEEINSENVKSVLGEYDGILVPGGFGNRGIQGPYYGDAKRGDKQRRNDAFGSISMPN